MKNKYADEDDDNELNAIGDASHLIEDAKNAKGYRPIAIIEVKPREDSKISLGTFSKTEPPVGFAVEVYPEPDPEGSLTTKIVSVLKEKSERYELMLLLDNYGIKTVTVEVSELKKSR